MRLFISPAFIKDVLSDRGGQGMRLTLSSPSSGAKVTATQCEDQDAGRPWMLYVRKGQACVGVEVEPEFPLQGYSSDAEEGGKAFQSQSS